MEHLPAALRRRWLTRFASQLRQTVPPIDLEEATGLAFACGAHTLLLAPEEAADVIADPEIAHRPHLAPTGQPMGVTSQHVGDRGGNTIGESAFSAPHRPLLPRPTLPVPPGPPVGGRGPKVGRYNDRHIEAAARECERVVLAWGVHAATLERPREVRELLRWKEVEPHCLRPSRRAATRSTRCGAGW